MIKPTLYIDLDNVVFDTVDAIKTLYDENYRLYDNYKCVDYNAMTSYDFRELQLLTKEKLNEYFCSGRFFDVVNCIEGAELSIATLNGFNQYPVTLVSIGTPENIKGKQQWIDNVLRGGFELDVDFVGLNSFDKSEIDMSGGILIDDELKNLETSNADVKICFGDYEWNKDWTGLRAAYWFEVRKLVYEEVRKLESNSKT